ncbi:hypothetical protein AKJ16_DCAP00178 [Drosera capensis]
MLSVISTIFPRIVTLSPERLMKDEIGISRALVKYRNRFLSTKSFIGHLDSLKRNGLGSVLLSGLRHHYLQSGQMRWALPHEPASLVQHGIKQFL